LPLADDAVIVPPVEGRRDERDDADRRLDERAERAPVLAGLATRERLQPAQPDRPARRDDVPERVTTGVIGGEGSGLVPPVRGAEGPVVTEIVEDHPGLVEAVATDDDLLEPDHIRTHPLALRPPHRP